MSRLPGKGSTSVTPADYSAPPMTRANLNLNRILPVSADIVGEELDLARVMRKVVDAEDSGRLTEPLSAEIHAALGKEKFDPTKQYNASQDLQAVDDPETDYTLATPIAWNEVGRIATLRDLVALVDADADANRHADWSGVRFVRNWTKIVGTAGLACAMQRVSTNLQTDPGRFSVAKFFGNYRIMTQGATSLPMGAEWYRDEDGRLLVNQDFDSNVDSSTEASLRATCVRRLTPNHIFLRVPKGFVGVATLGRPLSNEEHKGAGNVRDQDPILVSQGKYVLRETDFHDISVVKNDPTKDIIELGSPAIAYILNIKPGQHGGCVPATRGSPARETHAKNAGPSACAARRATCS